VAVLSAQNVFKVFLDGNSDRVVLYALRKVTTSDTVDVGLGALGDFLAPKQAVCLGTTVAGTVAASIAGTVITMPAGLSADAGYMLVWGASA
jgi:hypothetical protein